MDSEVGTVTRIQNSANVTRQGKFLELQVGAVVRENDEIQSGPDARVEITFTDGTKLTISENSVIAIDKFLFDPDADVGTILLRALQGPFRFITGNIGKLEKKQIEVQSRFGVIGVRGTDFWAGPSQNVYGVLLLKGIVTVFNREGGRILSVPGEGVNLKSANEPPGEVTVWGAARAQAALDTVAFK
ncbi:MAG: FecR family protein [Sneathiella sp.]|nr:FecR family protein [Sneathiella sp.]